MVFQEAGAEMRQKLVDERVERARTIDDYVPFDVAEFETNFARPLPLMTTLFAEGTEEALESMKHRCRKENVGGLIMGGNPRISCTLRCEFLVAFSHLYYWVCPSVGRSIGRSVRHTRAVFLRNGFDLNKIASRT